jgi:pimeloyl-ACP methyl ester carboxylesterase
MGDQVRVGDLDIWTEQVGEGPDVLLIGGLGDTVESWQFQLDGLADRYHLIAFDNRGAGRTAMPEKLAKVEVMADDAAGLLQALGIFSAHVAGFSMGSAIAQELALRHPELVQSLVLESTYARPDALFRSQLNFWRWLPEVAPSERAFFEAFFTWVYTPRAHADGSVEQIVEEALAFAHPQSVEAFQAQVDVCLAHDTSDRLSEIAAPTLVMAGELDTILPPRFGRGVAEGIPGAQFEVLSGESTSPSRRCPTSGTPASTPSGRRSWPGTEGRSDVRRVGGRMVSTGRGRQVRMRPLPWQGRSWE